MTVDGVMSSRCVRDVVREGRHITLRNVPPLLAKRLRERTYAKGASVNATVLELLKEALAIDPRRQRLEERHGTWREGDLARIVGLSHSVLT